MANPVLIFWDYDNTPIPRNGNPHNIVENIRKKLHDQRINGPLKIFAYGDFNRNATEIFQNALASQHVCMEHISTGAACHKKMLADMMLKVLDVHMSNEPFPPYVMLISGDKDFLYVLQLLKSRDVPIIHSSIPHQMARGYLDLRPLHYFIWPDVVSRT